MESHPTNFATDSKPGQVLQTDLLTDNSRPNINETSNSYASPLWLSTTGYFLIALTISLGLFVIIWGLLRDEGEYETLWIPAGISILVMSLALAAREVVLRRARTRYLLLHEQFGSAVVKQRVKIKSEKKFTLEQNAAALSSIKLRADEANLALATPEKHLEVFNASHAYLETAKSELLKIHVGSPRLPALRSGIKNVEVIHKHHLLRWAEEETRRLMREANVMVLTNEKVIMAHRAVETLDFALKFYPEDEQLVSSRKAVQEFAVSARIAHYTESAEREAFKEHYRRAIDYYQDALFYLSRESLSVRDGEIIKSKLEKEIEKLNLILSSKKGTRKRLSSKK